MPAKKSRLEEILLEHLKSEYPELELIQRARAIKKTRSGKSRYELDLWIPSLQLAFEVQDFATHSRDADDELGHPWRRSKKKNGPRLHELKRQLAREQLGVLIVDIWQDELESGGFQKIVAQAISSARNS